MKQAPGRNKEDYSEEFMGGDDAPGFGIALDGGAYAPVRGYEGDAGIDLRTPARVTIKKGGSAVIDTGVAIDIPRGYYGKLESKSGLNVLHGIVSLGGVIDSGYTGTIKAKLYNLGDGDYTFNPGDKIVQLIIHRHYTDRITQVETGGRNRDKKGFGSSGR